ncbi:MAG: 50S ribosomal protein L13 [Asticcacaulis sp.]
MLTSTTAARKPADVEKKWIVIDAEDAVLGRLAAYIAMRLRGKHKPDFTPHTDSGDHIVVINAEKIHLTGKKDNEIFYWHTGHPGGVKQRTLGQIRDGKYPERLLMKAVERMMPKESPLARSQMTHLRIFAGPNHTHQAQSPEDVNFKGLSRKNVRSQ